MGWLRQVDYSKISKNLVLRMRQGMAGHRLLFLPTYFKPKSEVKHDPDLIDDYDEAKVKWEMLSEKMTDLKAKFGCVWE